MMAGYEELSKIRTRPYRMRTISIIKLSLTESDIWLLTSCNLWNRRQIMH